MRKRTINFARMNDKKQLHTYLRRKLPKCDYYSDNLDSLHDGLTTIFEDTVLCLKNTAFREEDPFKEYKLQTLELLRDASEENKHLILEIEE